MVLVGQMNHSWVLLDSKFVFVAWHPIEEAAHPLGLVWGSKRTSWTSQSVWDGSDQWETGWFQSHQVHKKIDALDLQCKHHGMQVQCLNGQGSMLKLT